MWTSSATSAVTATSTAAPSLTWARPVSPVTLPPLTFSVMVWMLLAGLAAAVVAGLGVALAASGVGRAVLVASAGAVAFAPLAPVVHRCTPSASARSRGQEGQGRRCDSRPVSKVCALARFGGEPLSGVGFDVVLHVGRVLKADMRRRHRGSAPLPGCRSGSPESTAPLLAGLGHPEPGARACARAARRDSGIGRRVERASCGASAQEGADAGEQRQTADHEARRWTGRCCSRRRRRWQWRRRRRAARGGGCRRAPPAAGGRQHEGRRGVLGLGAVGRRLLDPADHLAVGVGLQRLEGELLGLGQRPGADVELVELASAMPAVPGAAVQMMRWTTAVTGSPKASNGFGRRALDQTRGPAGVRLDPDARRSGCRPGRRSRSSSSPRPSRSGRGR